MAIEFDLVRMDVAPSRPIKTIDIRKNAPNFFSSSDTLEKARSACKRSKYLHFSSYDADVGLMKACAENGCALVIAISDILPLPPYEKAKKIARMKRFAKLAYHYHAKIIVCTLARNEYELRSAFELKMIGEYIGVKPEL